MAYQRYRLTPDRDGDAELAFYMADNDTDLPKGADTGSLAYVRQSGLIMVFERGVWDSKAGFEKNIRRLLELILTELSRLNGRN